MDGTGERGAFERFAMWVRRWQRDADLGGEARNAADGGADHFLLHGNGGAFQVDRVTLREDAHDGEHARAERRGDEVRRGEGFAAAVIVGGRIGEELLL